MDETNVANRPSDAETAAYQQLVTAFRHWPIPDKEVLKDLPMFLTRPTLGHILFLDHLYQLIVDVPGSIFEFGVRWGRGISLFISLRTLREPHNFSRFVYGFDTFEGFPSVSAEDGSDSIVNRGELRVPTDYMAFLQSVLSNQERLAPRGEFRRFELIRGDATVSLPKFLEENPHAMCALAYFDFDLYKPTLECLKLIESRLTSNSVLVFDEFTLKVFPGETIAVREFLESRNYEMKRHPMAPYAAYAVKR